MIGDLNGVDLLAYRPLGWSLRRFKGRQGWIECFIDRYLRLCGGSISPNAKR